MVIHLSGCGSGMRDFVEVVETKGSETAERDVPSNQKGQ